MALMTLRELFDKEVQSASAVFEKEGAVLPSLVVQTDNGKIECHLLAVPKEDAIRYMHDRLQKPDVVNFVYTSEVWMKSYAKDEKAEVPPDGRVEHLPGREEAVMLMGESITEPPIHGVRRIVRDGDKATLDPIKIMDEGTPEGRFVGLLRQPNIN